jgi:hypothetical protein
MQSQQAGVVLVKPQQEKSKFRLGQTVGLLAMILLTDAAMTGGRIHREVAVETAHIFAAAYEEGRNVGLFW